MAGAGHNGVKIYNGTIPFERSDADGTDWPTQVPTITSIVHTTATVTVQLHSPSPPGIITKTQQVTEIITSKITDPPPFTEQPTAQRAYEREVPPETGEVPVHLLGGSYPK
jgi:hypothetical protein